jgi:16S rRNA C1402 (ribose-2'-O) methylase RsmI
MSSCKCASKLYSVFCGQGEITLLIGGCHPASRSEPPDQAQLQAKLEGLLRAGASASSAAKLAAAEYGVPKRAVYDLAVQLAAEQGSQTE